MMILSAQNTVLAFLIVLSIYLRINEYPLGTKKPPERGGLMLDSFN
jgi:hypothetical protein